MFIAYGPGITNPIALEKLFVKPAVVKVSKSAKTHKLSDNDADRHAAIVDKPASFMQKAYQSPISNKQRSLKAYQVMTSPVVFLQSYMQAKEAINTLASANFRHLPVLSEQGALIGLLSDRDIYRCMCSSDSTCMHCANDSEPVLIKDIMKTEVLAANIDADVRYIARLLVENRVGAMPIVENDTLVGIITRSDILRAVMLHFNLDVWE